MPKKQRCHVKNIVRICEKLLTLTADRETGIFATSSGDFRRIGLVNYEFRRQRPGIELQKPAIGGPFCRYHRTPGAAQSLSDVQSEGHKLSCYRESVT